MFCSNCGSELSAGAKFCSECGTRVEDINVRDLGTLAFDEVAGTSEKVVEKPAGAEEALKERVSFDWSNVIDEPQKKEVPQGIKSPWSAATGSITERELYSEMTQSDDKSRTLNYIDILKADREERERVATDKSFEYTEVLEIDPEMTGGTKPPKLHYAPLYEDVDEPVKTPFDDMASSESDAISEETEYEAPVIELHEEDKIGSEPKTRKEASKFEIPDFLKKAVGFGAPKDDDKEPLNEAVVEEPVFEAPVETIAEEPAFAAPAEATAEEAAAPESVLESSSEEIKSDDTSDIYLDEDLYLDIDESSSVTGRMSRVDAHTMAGVYDDTDTDDDDDNDIEKSVDEKELFTEMSETPAGHTGMTIAAPADEEEEIEALKRRLAELTGAVDMASESYTKEPAASALSADSEIEEKAIETADAAMKEEIIEPSDAATKEKTADSAESENDSFEALGSEFTFEPEITPADEALFAGLTHAGEAEHAAPVSKETLHDVTTAEIQEEEAPAFEESNEGDASTAKEPTFEDFMFEPEVTADDDAMFAELASASEIAKPAPSFGLKSEDIEDITTASVPSPGVQNTPAVEKMEFEAPTPIISDDQKEAFNSLVFDFPQQKDEEPVNDSPIVGFAPAITEAVEFEKSAASENVFEAPAASAENQEEATAPIRESVSRIPAEPVSAASDISRDEEVIPKTSDAVSLEELEKDLFGATTDDTEHEPTKKIDKFYTLYRKNEEFQRLLDEEYSRLKGENADIPKESEMPVPAAQPASAAISLDDFAKDSTSETFSPEANSQAEKTAAILEEIARESRPVEDETIYRVDMPEDLAEIAQQTAEKNDGFSVETASTTEDVKSLGLDGTEAAAAAVAGAAVVAGAAGDETGKASKKAAKKAEREAKKAAKKEKKAQQTEADSQVEYESVDGGSTFLTILAVLVAILLVVLLAIILILHVAPDSGIAMAIDHLIENIASKFSAVDMMGGYKLL